MKLIDLKNLEILDFSTIDLSSGQNIQRYFQAHGSKLRSVTITDCKSNQKQLAHIVSTLNPDLITKLHLTTSLQDSNRY